MSRHDVARDPVVSYRLGTWNVHNAQRRRPADQVAEEVADLLASEDLDVLTVQEFARYARATRRRLRGTHRVAGARFGSRSRRDAAVIVRRPIRSRWRRIHRLTRHGWERAPHNRDAGLHPARRMPSILVGRGPRRLRVASPHLPPGPHTWPLRGAAFEEALDQLGRLARRWSRRRVPWVAAGDYNRTPAGLTAAFLPRRTTGRVYGRGIDLVVAGGGSTVTDLRRLEGFGTADHDPRVCVVSIGAPA